MKTLVLVLSLLVALTLAAPPSKPSPKKVPAVKSTPKTTCTICQGPGEDCKSATTSNTCDKCAKLTGIADDPNEVPDWIWMAMPKGSKELMSSNKGKKVTIRGCATQAMIDAATVGGDYEEYGCSDFDEFFGFKEATGCLCKENC